MPAKSHFHVLRKKWSLRSDEAKRKLWEKHREALDWIYGSLPAKETVAGTAVGAMMLANTTLPVFTAFGELKKESEPQATVSSQGRYADKTKEFSTDLSTLLPGQMRTLTPEEEAQIGKVLSDEFEVKVSASLEGRRLNRSYGYIGAEQHLMRYAGDSMFGHLDQKVTNNKFFFSSGMAPGRGAWGYFSKSKTEMTDKDVEREKWYIAVQTFLAPGFSQNVSDRYTWFKYRKMLVVNPQTGQAVVSDIADAGPAAWTGKHLGGSPEVMTQLGLHKGSRKGAVLYYFIDDPDDRIPLGPV